jgi:hypothetical protein
MLALVTDAGGLASKADCLFRRCPVPHSHVPEDIR